VTIVRAMQAQRPEIRAFVGEQPRLEVGQPDVDELAELGAENLALKEALASLRQSVEAKVRTARAEGRAEGRADGLAAAERDHSATSAALVEAAQDAAAAFGARLTELEGLAALLSHSALARILDRPEHWSDLVLSTIRQQVARLRHEAIVQVRVSQSDFPDPADLASAAEQCSGISLVAERELPGGSCLIKLKLGEIDASLPSQWQAISGLLLEMAAESSPT
jgi:flagellar biosynthesis/type III secretory pathway protein FliH